MDWTPANIEAKSALCKLNQMPDLPDVSTDASEPMSAWALSGVYFIVRKEALVYVGQSKNIGQRLRTHEHVKRNDKFGWIIFDESEAPIAELFYIWLLRPVINRETPYEATLSIGDPAELELAVKQLHVPACLKST